MKPANPMRLLLSTIVTAGLLTVPGWAGAQTSGADLAVDKTDAPDPATSGAPITYVVTVDNDGPEAATNVEVEDILPLGSTFVAAVASQGSCSQVLVVVTCNLGSLADEAAATVAIVITYPGTGTINNLAAAESPVLDPNPLNNGATETTTVTGDGGGEGTDLWIEKSDAPDPLAPNADLTYVATVANVGSEDVTGVLLTDVLPLGVQFVSATPSQGSCSAPVLVLLTCQIGAVADDGSATVNIVVRPTGEGTITNTVTAAGSAPDTNPGNNLSTATTTVSADATTPGGGGGGGGGGGKGAGQGGCTILGTALDDKLTGTAQDDVICGLDGNDLMVGLNGRDVLRGGKDNDRGNGGKGPDTLTGQSGKDRLRGAAKRDRLNGGGSRDRLAGGPGKDRINGGAGRDRCTRGKGDKITKCP
jgi:uncharacterized repeat protein (TIGR01451 family)